MRYTMLICGGREFDDYEFMKRELDAITNKHGRPLVLMHGGAPGADSLASRYAYEEKIDLAIIGAQWGTYGSKAGPIRNAFMANRLYKDDVLVAFPTKESRGTWNMIGLCRDKDIFTYVYDGRG